MERDAKSPIDAVWQHHFAIRVRQIAAIFVAAGNMNALYLNHDESEEA